MFWKMVLSRALVWGVLKKPKGVGKKAENTKDICLFAWGAYEVHLAYAFDAPLIEVWAFCLLRWLIKKICRKTIVP